MPNLKDWETAIKMYRKAADDMEITAKNIQNDNSFTPDEAKEVNEKFANLVKSFRELADCLMKICQKRIDITKN